MPDSQSACRGGRAETERPRIEASQCIGTHHHGKVAAGNGDAGAYGPCGRRPVRVSALAFVAQTNGCRPVWPGLPNGSHPPASSASVFFRLARPNSKGPSHASTSYRYASGVLLGLFQHQVAPMTSVPSWSRPQTRAVQQPPPMGIPATRLVRQQSLCARLRLLLSLFGHKLYSRGAST